MTGLESGLAAAKAAAGEKYVNILGAGIARQCLDIGASDGILAGTAPVPLGDGVRLFNSLGGANFRVERLSLAGGPPATSLLLRVVR